jgi:hypothetical protein
MLKLRLFRCCHPFPAAPDAQPPGPSRRRRHCWQPRQAAGSGRLRAQPTWPPPFPAPTLTHQPPQAPLHRVPPPDSRSRRPPRLAAGVPPHQSLTAPTKPANRPLATQGPSPARAPAGGWPEFGRTAAARPPRDDIAKLRFFPGSLLQKVNSNSKTL